MMGHWNGNWASLHEQRPNDPVIDAAEALTKAEKAFLRVVERSLDDEFSTAYLEAAARWEESEQIFADAIPGTPAGALLKLFALAELLRAASPNPNSIEMRHVQSLMSYLSALAAEQSPEAAISVPWRGAASA